MKIRILAGLSAPQNQLFRRWLTGSGLDTTEVADPLDADLAFVCGLPASQMGGTHRPLLAPVLDRDRYRGRPWYFVDVVARSRTQPLNGRWAFNEVASFSGHVAVHHGLRLRGFEASEWLPTGSHQASLEAVAQGQADLAGIDSMILDLAPYPDLELVTSWGPWPAPPIVASRSLDPQLVTDLGRELVDDGVSWVPVDDSHLDPIRLVTPNRK